MGNNTKSEQDDLCLALINPELCNLKNCAFV